MVSWIFRFLTAPFRFIAYLLRGGLRIIRTIIMYASVFIFVVVFAGVFYAMIETFDSTYGKASLSAVEEAMKIFSGMLPWWIPTILVIIAVFLWFRYKFIGSAVLAAVTAIVAVALIL